jgi:putative transcriptional regulator
MSIDIDKVAQAIEDDASQPLDGLRQALAEAQAGLGRITTPEQILLRSVRTKTGLTQTAFAKQIATPLATLRDWEQGRFAPPGAVTCLLQILNNHPELSRELASA